MTHHIPGLPDDVDDPPSALPVQPELQPVLPLTQDDDEPHENGQPEHFKNQTGA